jgi:hypothetical protein
MSTPSGVEENEDSRFVDYTIVSDFEELQNTIEISLKGWMSSGEDSSRGGDTDSASKAAAAARKVMASTTTEIEYKDSKLILTFHKHDEAAPECPIPHWFALEHGTRYVVLSRGRAWTSHTKSERKYLFGALVSALNAGGYLDLHAFATASDFDTIDSSPEVDGYGIATSCSSCGTGNKNINNNNNNNNNSSSLPRVVHYESSQLTSIDLRHPLFYADGVRIWYTFFLIVTIS